MLFIGLSDTIETVCADDDAVTPHEGVEASWFPRFTDKAEVGSGAHRFKVRPLNGRELSRVYNAQNLERLYAAAEIAVVDIYPPVTDRDGELMPVREAVGHLGLASVSGLFAIIDAITHGQDPFAEEEAAAPAAPKSDEG